MDLRDPIYRDVLLEEIQRSVIDHGLDGIFLDTVGDIDEYVKHAGVRQEMREAYRTLLRQITGRFGPIPMIQNRGFNSLELAAPYIEGILWEDWRADWEQDAWTRKEGRDGASRAREGTEGFLRVLLLGCKKRQVGKKAALCSLGRAGRLRKQGALAAYSDGISQRAPWIRRGRQIRVRE